MTFQVARVQTVTYWVDYSRAQVEALLADAGFDAFDLREMDDQKLSETLQGHYGQNFDLDEAISRASEKHNDVTDDHIRVRVIA